MLHFPRHIELVTQQLQYSELSHRVISHNLANVNTPGYTRLQVDFPAYLAKESTGSPLRIVEDESLPARMDGNNVDIDRELGQLNRNSLLFETYSQILTAHLGMMRLALGRS